MPLHLYVANRIAIKLEEESGKNHFTNKKWRKSPIILSPSRKHFIWDQEQDSSWQSFVNKFNKNMFINYKILQRTKAIPCFDPPILDLHQYQTWYPYSNLVLWWNNTQIIISNPIKFSSTICKSLSLLGVKLVELITTLFVKQEQNKRIN